MSRPILPFLALLILAGGTAATGVAQDASPPASSAPSSQEATIALQPATIAPTKKVWTNDDVGDLREHSEISTVGGPSGTGTRPGQKGALAPKGKDAKWYQAQIAKLEAQIPPMDSQIASLQSAIDGNATGDTKTSTRTYGVKGGDWRTELLDLQAKRADIESHIDALEDEARHSEIPARALP
jgi:hypothetical protein